MHRFRTHSLRTFAFILVTQCGVMSARRWPIPPSLVSPVPTPRPFPLLPPADSHTPLIINPKHRLAPSSKAPPNINTQATPEAACLFASMPPPITQSLLKFRMTFGDNKLLLRKLMIRSLALPGFIFGFYSLPSSLSPPFPRSLSSYLSFAFSSLSTPFSLLPYALPTFFLFPLPLPRPLFLVFLLPLILTHLGPPSFSFLPLLPTPFHYFLHPSLPLSFPSFPILLLPPYHLTPPSSSYLSLSSIPPLYPLPLSPSSPSPLSYPFPSFLLLPSPLSSPSLHQAPLILPVN